MSENVENFFCMKCGSFIHKTSQHPEENIEKYLVRKFSEKDTSFATPAVPSLSEEIKSALFQKNAEEWLLQIKLQRRIRGLNADQLRRVDAFIDGMKSGNQR